MIEKMSNVVTKPATYSEAEVALIRGMYLDGNMSPADIAKDPRVDRTEKSVRGKLVSMGVYRKVEKPAAKPKKDEGPTKKELQGILVSLGFSQVAADGLGNATKGAITEVIERVRAANPQVEAVAEPVADVA
jgi:hypothetical protein